MHSRSDLESTASWDDEAASLVAAGFEHHQAGRHAQAEILYRQVLARDPDQRDAVMLCGLLLADGPDIAGAETLLKRYLIQMPDDPIACRQLGLLAQRRDDHLEALNWLMKSLAAVPAHGPTHHALALALQHLGLRDEALAAFRRSVALRPDLAVAWHDLGHFHEEDDALDQAEAAYRQALAADENCVRAYSRLGAILDHTHRPDEAEWFWAELARRHRVDEGACTGDKPAARLLLVGGAGPCNIRPEFLFDRRFFATYQVNVLAEPDAEQMNVLAQVPACDLAFGLLADPDRGARFWPEAQALIGRLDCPVLNPPDQRVLRTERDQVAVLLSGIPGLVVPATRRLDRAALLDLARTAPGLERPLLLRPCGSHAGGDLVQIDAWSAIEPYLADLPGDAYYLTDYHDYRSTDGLYRKYRFVFVDRQVYPYHLAISPNWMIHYFRADNPDQEWMRREEAAFLEDPTTGFPGDLAPIAAVAARLDLDYAGIDCGVLPDGRVLLFEANPSMLVHLQDPPELFPYKHQFVPRIRDAMTRMILERCAAIPSPASVG